MNAPRWFRGAVSEDGATLQLAAPDRYAAHVARYAGQEVRVAVRPFAGDYTAEMLGYYRGHIVEVLREAMGEPTNEAAHHALVHALHCLPWEMTAPSTSRLQWDRVDLDEHIFRAIVFLTDDLGLVVDEAEPDPVRRFEQRMRRGRGLRRAS